MISDTISKTILRFGGLFVVAIMLVCACGSPKNVAYLQDRNNDQSEKMEEHAGIVIQAKDMLSIVVSSRNPELVAMFNLPLVTYQAGTEMVTNGSMQRIMGYVVDNEGYIDFPILGKLHVNGKTRWELAETIKQMLTSQGLLTDAVVTVEFMNFKVSVMGEVTRPGTYTVQGDKVTLLQALSLAGDLTIFGMRENVSVIREKDGQRTIYEVDLTSTQLFKSPAYFLQQNDIVYVQPSKVKARQATVDDKGMRLTSIFVSSGSLLVSIATLVISLIGK